MEPNQVNAHGQIFEFPAKFVQPDFDPELNFCEGLAAENRGDQASAWKHYEQNVLNRTPPHLPSMQNLGVMLYHKGCFEEAAKFFLIILAWCPSHADAYANLANTWDSLGKRVEAKEAYEKALHFEPENQQALFNLAELCERLGMYFESIKLYLKYAKAYPNDRRMIDKRIANCKAKILVH